MNITNLVGDGSAPWEIQLSEPEFRRQSGNENQIKDRYQHEVPTYMKITMAFNPIHNFLPRKNKREREHTATFVTPNFKIGHPNYYLPQNTQYKKLISPLALAFGPQENPISQVSTLINVPEQNIVQK
jgi:hypothetical protein